MTTQTQTQYRDWADFIHAIVAELERQGRTFGVIRHDDLVPAFKAGVPAADFVAAAIARTDAELIVLEAMGRNPDAFAAWQHARNVERLDDDAAAGFTRD